MHVYIYDRIPQVVSSAADIRYVVYHEFEIKFEFGIPIPLPVRSHGIVLIIRLHRPLEDRGFFESTCI